MIPSSPWHLSSSSESNRDLLIRFWINAPVDQLETLWAQSFGIATSKLVSELSTDFVFTDEQIALRSSIGIYFDENGLSGEYSHQLMLANFLLSPPGLLVINNVDDFFPPWLSSAYSNLYHNPPTKSPLVSTPSTRQDPSVTSSTNSVPNQPDFGEFPVSLQDLINDRIHLNRLLGLSNLYYIDPEDRDIYHELVKVRRALAFSITQCPENELEQFWSTEFGDRYWSLIRSGIQSEQLSPEDQAIKDDVVLRLNPSLNGGFGTSGAVNAFLVAMMYFIPGSMKVDNPSSKLPAWLYPHYEHIFAAAITT